MNKIFKPTVNIRRKFATVIENYKQATYRDNNKIKEICRKATSLLKQKLELDSVSITEGNITDEQFSALLNKNEISVEIIFTELLQQYSAVVKTSQQENLIQQLTSISIIDAAVKVNELIQKEFVAANMESPEMTQDYSEAKIKMEIIQQRQKATMKWFLMPALTQKEDILRFLESLNEKQLKIVTEEM